MSSNQPEQHPNQTFLDSELLFRRVHRLNMKLDGRASFLAFELPDMSVNRERLGTVEESLKGFRPQDWGVVSFQVADIPPREVLLHTAHCYYFRARHVPEPGNFAHSEIRVWREDNSIRVLVTFRLASYRQQVNDI